METPTETFDPQRFWEQRLTDHPDITGVGYLGRSPKFLEYQYRSRQQRIELALRRFGLADLTGRSVLDVGSGIGIWLNYWHAHKAERVVGLDFTQTSVDILKAKFPNDLIAQADVTVAPLPLPPEMRFDVISAFDVLLHIVDDEKLSSAFANMASVCTPDGWLILSDPLIYGGGYVPPKRDADYVLVRTVADYDKMLAEHGFTIEAILPVSVVLSDPLEARNRVTFTLLHAWWKATGVWGRSKLLSSMIGPSAVMADQFACKLGADGRTSGPKLIFARKSRNG